MKSLDNVIAIYVWRFSRFATIVRAPSYIYEKATDGIAATRPLERFCPSVMKNQPKRPQEEDVKQPNEAEEELHVYPRLLSDPDLEQGDVESVERSRREREEVSPYRVRVFFPL